MNAPRDPVPDSTPPQASFARRAGRALRLRCPNCGGGPVLESWFRLRPRCPVCGLRTERGEQDFFLGAMVINIAIAEGVLVLFFVGLVVALWPDVPWTFLQWGAPALMLLAPFLFYPFSKTLWMAVDLQFRPLTPEELDWHRESGEDSFRPERER
jgi:uncharacterized protein (DUF983 family)